VKGSPLDGCEHPSSVMPADPPGVCPTVTAEQYVIPLHTPMDKAAPVPPQLANNATDARPLV